MKLKPFILRCFGPKAASPSSLCDRWCLHASISSGLFFNPLNDVMGGGTGPATAVTHPPAICHRLVEVQTWTRAGEATPKRVEGRMVVLAKFGGGGRQA